MESGRKPRVDSRGEIQKIMAAANIEMKPPAHMKVSKEEMPYWNNVIAEYAKAHWTNHQLELTVVLARTMRQLDKAQRELAGQDLTQQSPQGTISNALVNVISRLLNDVLGIRRSLALHARAKGGGAQDKPGKGDNRNAAIAREKGKEFEKLAQISGKVADDLIARPN